MSWGEYVAAGFLALGALSTVSMVGKEREPISSAQATFSVFVATLLILALAFS